MNFDDKIELQNYYDDIDKEKNVIAEEKYKIDIEILNSNKELLEVVDKIKQEMLNTKTYANKVHCNNDHDKKDTKELKKLSNNNI